MMSAKSDQDLWGDLPSKRDTRMPSDLLREQAEALNLKTDGRLTGKLEILPTLSNGAQVSIRFGVSAPALDYYTSIFEVEQQAATGYPCSVRRTLAKDFLKGGGFNTQKAAKVQNEEDFVSTVRSILQSDEVRTLIGGLLETVRVAESLK